ncbi:uncharacterized protein FOMMEDRAFT_161215 [Fomitiporia mediterranea MF3/22]|uniref:uncharacterized protein n=1 Tax=Fomitiporia mediterranea (strain MF3/22) TaxID=694068 RepID=UPI000440832A|nr:uncharacterized protein FOMMEDRAFT_161215 [Fomitiporia mediterranea MF3/22]EJC99001.1 hypothetical protein FOMMEDRAFT_161215 [Fomitiporia mediterranea MF3/22]
MAPPSSTDTVPFSEEINPIEDGSMKDAWNKFSDWVLHAAQGINDETLEHPYFISFALLILWAWPHILMLPVWFGKDAYRRMDGHARNAVGRATAPVRRRKRDTFMATYHSMTNASYEPYDTSRPPLFGGTPLSDGDFSVEEDRRLPIALRVIRWFALAWSVFILGRELYFFVARY